MTTTTTNENEYEQQIFDEIYYGSKPVFFRHVEGQVHSFFLNEWIDGLKEEERMITIQRLQKHFVDGDQYPIVVPGIPALDFVKKLPALDFGNDAELNSSLPEVIQRPLIKCHVNESTSSESVCKGVASGRRSALIKIAHGKWYRLKGCGNDNEGFPVRLTSSPVIDATDGSKSCWQDVRGCAFPHTALRELVVAGRLIESLDATGVISANVPVAYALYGPSLSPFPSLPDARPTCVIAETVGDRRLGTHVLAGLELLLSALILENKVDSQLLLQAFPIDRPGRETGKLEDIIDTGAFMTDYMLGTSLQGGERDGRGLMWPTTPRDNTTLAFMGAKDSALPERSPATGVYPPQWTNDGPIAMPSKWQRVWDDACTRLQGLLDTLKRKTSHDNTTVLAYTYSRIGFDAGRVLRGLHQCGLSWGTYQDEMCRKEWDEWHCNAHANNFVIIPEGYVSSAVSTTTTVSDKQAPQGTLLSFLDLDMAFSRESFISEDGTVGVAGAAFEKILWREHVSLMEVLAGSDSSTGVPQIAKSVVASSRGVVVTAIQTSLYDTLILGYLAAYQGGHVEAPMQFDEDLHAAAHCVIRLAIILMADFVA